MNMRQITELCLKILALYWVLRVANSVSSEFIFFTYKAADLERLVQYLMSNALPGLITAVILFFIAKPFSKYIAPLEMDHNSITIDVKSIELHYVLLSIFGFILIALSISPMINSFITIVTVASKSPDEIYLSKMFLLGYCIQLLIGLWFALGSKGISGFIYKLRYTNR